MNLYVPCIFLYYLKTFCLLSFRIHERRCLSIKIFSSSQRCMPLHIHSPTNAHREKIKFIKDGLNKCFVKNLLFIAFSLVFLTTICQLFILVYNDVRSSYRFMQFKLEKQKICKSIFHKCSYETAPENQLFSHFSRFIKF